MPVQAKCRIVPLYPPYFPPALYFVTLHSEVLQHSASIYSNSQRSLRREGYWLLHHVQIKFQAFRVLCICQVHWNTDTSSCNLHVTLAVCTWLFCMAHGLTSSPERDGITVIGMHQSFSLSGFSVKGEISLCEKHWEGFAGLRETSANSQHSNCLT